MVKTSVSLSEDEAAALRQASQGTGRSQAELIREGVRHIITAADTSLIVLAARFGTTRLLTVDERRFRAVTPLHPGHFTVLPAGTS